jgi:hypothetical protein
MPSIPVYTQNNTHTSFNLLSAPNATHDVNQVVHSVQRSAEMIVHAEERKIFY